MTPAEEARHFLRGIRSGVLSTHSVKLKGYPFGSIAPFVLDHDCNPLILISTLAEHTRNIKADPKVSLIAFDPGSPDMQAGARLTLVGSAEPVIKDEPSSRARYLRYLPQAEQYFEMHDFIFHRILVQQARFIGGFGNIHWIVGDQIRTPPNRLAEQEAGILAHMNTDHADALRAYCEHRHHVEARDVQMVGIDYDGFDVRADGKLLRFAVDEPITDAQSARTALMAMSKAIKT